MEVKELKKIANNNRKRIVDMVYRAKVGHVGGALSVIDLVTAISELDIDYSSPNRSRIVLSKGHACPALYAELVQKGILEESELNTFRRLNSRLQGHPYTQDIPELDATTGLLGQGFSMAVGMAIVKKQYDKDHRVYAIAGDGEMDEGQMWEAIMMAAHNKLNNLIFIIDYNKLSSTHPTNEIINLEPLVEKMKAFNLYTIEIDGNNMEEIVRALDEVKQVTDKPIAIVANTVKDKGVSFMENVGKWHSSGLTDEEYKIAMEDLNRIEEAL